MRPAARLPELPELPHRNRTLVLVGWWLSEARASSARRKAARPDGLYAGIMEAVPMSLADHERYREGHTWVPKGHNGWLLPGLGELYHKTWGRAQHVAGLGLAGTAPKPILNIFCWAIAVGLVLLAGHFL